MRGTELKGRTAWNCGRCATTLSQSSSRLLMLGWPELLVLWKRGSHCRIFIRTQRSAPMRILGRVTQHGRRRGAPTIAPVVYCQHGQFQAHPLWRDVVDIRDHFRIGVPIHNQRPRRFGIGSSRLI